MCNYTPYIALNLELYMKYISLTSVRYNRSMFYKFYRSYTALLRETNVLFTNPPNLQTLSLFCISLLFHSVKFTNRSIFLFDYFKSNIKTRYIRGKVNNLGMNVLVSV